MHIAKSLGSSVEANFRHFFLQYGYTLFKAMEKELSGNVKEGTLFMLGMKMKPYETISGLIKKACAGIGTDELLLTCCIIRYQMVMKGELSFSMWCRYSLLAIYKMDDFLTLVHEFLLFHF